MKTLQLSIIFCLIVFGSFTPAWASVELDAYLPISGDPVTPQFKFEKLYQIDYPNGGKLKHALNERSLNITCSDSYASNQSIKQLMANINSQLISSKSPTTITNLELSYIFTLTSGQSSASMDYVIILKPTITGYVINNGGEERPSTLDASWISFAIEDPVVIDTKKCGQMEINHPLNIIENVFPDVYSIIYNTPGQAIFDSALNRNLIDSTPFLQQPIDRWDSLFDPAYTITDTAGPSPYKGEKVQVTTFSSGLSGLAQATPSRFYTDFTADTTYHLSSVDQSVGTINVQGNANPDRYLGNWAFVTILHPGPGPPLCCAVPWYETAWILVPIAVVAIIVFLVFYFWRLRK
jgi:hypothetical protein